MADTKIELEKSLELKKQLEWELSLDSSELVSHGWYHGALDRSTAEALLPQDGSFLVRDSATQPGHYVLSCRQGTHHLHFVINRVVIQPDTVYEHFQYQLEHEAYDTVPDLVTSYVGSGKPISMASGARIQFPSNRSVPLLLSQSGLNRGANHTATKQFTWKSSNMMLSVSSSDSLSAKGSNNNTLRKTNSLTSKLASGDNQPTTKTTTKAAFGAHIATKSISFSEQNSLLMQNNPYDLDDFTFKKNRSMSLSPGEAFQNSSGEGVEKREQADDKQQEVWDNNSSQGSPPAKPARNQAAVYQASGSDSGNGSGDSAQSLLPGENQPQTINKVNSIRRLDIACAEETLMTAPVVEYKQISMIDTSDFQTELFVDQDNKPLESDTLQTVKLLLRTSGPMILATHLTRVDLKYILNVSSGKNASFLEKITALELCLLAHGEQMRLDILERAECMKFLIVVTLLTCQSDAERADVLNDWIQLAIETKIALGNLYGFAIIMQGLCTKQVSSMENTWNILRQKHTHSAFTFESKLRPSYKNMNECVDSSPPNMTLPHLLPIVLLFKNSLDSEKACQEFGVNTSDFGLSVVAAHLEAARRYPEQIPFYEKNAKTVLGATPAPIDDLLLDLFKTEFHLKFLWGARGAHAPYYDRHTKLSDILETMAQRYLTPVACK